MFRKTSITVARASSSSVCGRTRIVASARSSHTNAIASKGSAHLLRSKAPRAAQHVVRSVTAQSARSQQAAAPSTRGLASQALAQHREADYNKKDAKFEFSAENQKEIKKYLDRYPDNYKRSACMPLLYLAQKQCGNWVPLAAMNKIAEILDMPPIRVYEVATFYTMYNREPVGKYHIQLCGTTPCQLCGAEEIRSAIEKELNIKEGQTSPDGLVTLSEVECLGACVNAPMIQVNNEHFYENLTPESMVNILRKWAKGEEVKPGPQNGQKDCEGPHGRTTLKDLSFIKPQSRDFAALKKEEAQKAKA